MNGLIPHRSWVSGIHARAACAQRALSILFVLAVASAGYLQAQSYTETVLHSFKGGSDGAFPYADLFRDAQGNLYGTTTEGGDPNCADSVKFGCGTVFKVDATGNETVLYRFTGVGDDGIFPYGGLVRDAHGNLYGTTSNGGSSESAGTVFKLDTTGKETVLYSFTGTGADGSNSVADVVMDAQHNLYGTTSNDGAFDSGTVFKVDATGKETVLYSFTGSQGDGAFPFSGLVMDVHGNLFGTTFNGGDSACAMSGPGCGTVFKVDSTGKETVLHDFTGNGGDGALPWGALVQDAQGNLYGTTLRGGDLTCDAPNGCGTVFKLDTTGKETVLYRFSATGGDGAGPLAGLVRDTQGNLYGTTSSGGASDNGTVFEVDHTGKETVLYSFTGADGDGAVPYAALVRDAKGNLYGTTSEGGASGNGTVFKLSPGVATTTTLTSSPNPSAFGQSVTFVAEVASTAGAVPDGEIVTFMKGAKVLGTAATMGGTASFTTSELKQDSNAIKADYPGDAKFTRSKSNTVVQVVSKATTKTVVTSSINPSKFGQAVTFTAIVSAPFGETPIGTVTFNRGGTRLATVQLSGEMASFTTTKLTVGKEPITAVYNGHNTFVGSSSKSLNQAVNQVKATTTLASSLATSHFRQAVTFIATVSSPFGGKVTGDVTFYDGSTALTTKQLRGGEARFTTGKLTPGVHHIRATLIGSTESTASSDSLTHTVKPKP